MEDHNPVTSIQLICCSFNEWFHKQCLKEQAVSLGDKFKCPSCGDTDSFRENMQMNGIYIPESSGIALYRSLRDENVDVEAAPPTKRRRIHKDWIYQQTFSSKSEADEYLENGNWRYFYSNTSTAGERITYRCGLVKFAGVQCEAGVVLIYDSRSSKIQLLVADAAHTHDNAPNKVVEIPLETQAEIRKLYEDNVTRPSMILANLVKKGLERPPKAKFDTFMKKLRHERYGNEKINCGQLEKWLQDNTSLPESDMEPFILNYEMNCEDKDKLDFRFFVSTKLLLQQAIGANKIHTDATYKINWQGFPVLVIGTTDLHRSFHPIGVAVCTTEQQKDFKFIFASVKQALNNIFSAEFKPKYLVADAAKAIHNAGVEVFGDILLVIMCWYHMRKNVSDHLPQFISDSKKQTQFLFDLDRLQLVKTIEIFDVAVQLFMIKWREESVGLIEYFENQWVHQNRNWFEGFAKQTPSTNNALESFNRLIKDNHTLRERMELGKFRIELFEMVKSWSRAYTSGLKTVILDAPELPLKLWTAGYNWAEENVKITNRRRGNKIIYRSSTVQTIDDSTNWQCFDDYKKNSFDFYDTVFKFPISRDNWLISECDCENYFKLYMCEHIIGIALRMKCITAPAEAKHVPIGQKRKRGRPAKAKPALVRQ